MGLFGPTQGFQDRQALRDQQAQSAQDLATQSAQYRMALERGTWDTLGPQFSEGLSRINSQLAGAGPLADSGGATALRSQLASRIYGQAQGDIGRGLSNFVGNYLNQSNQLRNQMRLMQLQRSMQPGGIGSFIGKGLGAVAGALLGGPAADGYSMAGTKTGGAQYSYPRYDSQTGGY